MKRSSAAIPFATVLLALAGVAPVARADLTLLSQFDPGLGELVGLAHDPADGSVWVYGGSDPDLRHYAADGTFLGAVPRPGESANDFDLEIAPEAMVLGASSIPAGTLLVINGEVGTADIYGVDPATGLVLGTLSTTFGDDHVVGGAWHPDLNTFFLVQDRVVSGTSNKSLVAQVDPFLGGVSFSFKVDVQLPGFTVNFGDLDVDPSTGNLLIASSDESSLAEFKTDGTFVQVHVLPAGITGSSGLGVGGDGLWLSSTGGDVTHLGNLPWTTLGGAMAGIAGLPTLTGSGSLVAGSPTTLAAAHCKSGAVASLIVGLAQVNLPFKGGTLVPSFDVLVAGLFTNGFGQFALDFPWPAGLPSGFALHYQLWIADAAGPKGFAATNGLRSVTP